MSFKHVVAQPGARFIYALRLDGCVRAVNRSLRALTARGHHLEYLLDWGGFRSPPEWFDHLLDQYWRWPATRNPMSWERGVFAALAIPEGTALLDLCCGGGFITTHFFSMRAARIIAVDFDPKAIAHASRHFKAPNVEFLCADIRYAMPAGRFETIVWNAAIEHFTEVEIADLLAAIKQRLSANGILAGYTIVETAAGKSHPEHEYEFKSKDDLVRLLGPHFSRVRVFETDWTDQYESRRNLYFYASNGILPFDEEWSKQRCARA